MNYTSDIKSVKEFGLVKRVLYNFVLSIFITLALSVIAIYAFNIRLDIVLSDSMVPTFYTDDIVVVMPFDDYKEGDIIEFKMSAISNPVTHRIKSKKGSGKNAVYTTQGDNVQSEDLSEVPASSINGKVIGIISNGKGIYHFIQSNYFLFIDIILGIWVLSSVLSGEVEIRKHNIAKI